jgi:hypothetical protein
MASLNISIHNSDLESVKVSASYYNAENTDLSLVIDGVRIFISDYAGGKALQMIADEIMKCAQEAKVRQAIEAEVTARLSEVEA